MWVPAWLILVLVVAGGLRELGLLGQGWEFVGAVLEFCSLMLAGQTPGIPGFLATLVAIPAWILVVAALVLLVLGAIRSAYWLWRSVRDTFD